MATDKTFNDGSRFVRSSENYLGKGKNKRAISIFAGYLTVVPTNDTIPFIEVSIAQLDNPLGISKDAQMLIKTGNGNLITSKSIWDSTDENGRIINRRNVSLGSSIGGLFSAFGVGTSTQVVTKLYQMGDRFYLSKSDMMRIMTEGIQKIRLEMMDGYFDMEKIKKNSSKKLMNDIRLTHDRMYGIANNDITNGF